MYPTKSARHYVGGNKQCLEIPHGLPKPILLKIGGEPKR